MYFFFAVSCEITWVNLHVPLLLCCCYCCAVDTSSSSQFRKLAYTAALYITFIKARGRLFACYGAFFFARFKFRSKGSFSDVLSCDFYFILKFNIWEARWIGWFLPPPHSCISQTPTQWPWNVPLCRRWIIQINYSCLTECVPLFEIDFYVQHALNYRAHYQQIQPVNIHTSSVRLLICLDCEYPFANEKSFKFRLARERLAFRSLTARYWVIMA